MLRKSGLVADSSSSGRASENAQKHSRAARVEPLARKPRVRARNAFSRSDNCVGHAMSLFEKCQPVRSAANAANDVEFDGNCGDLHRSVCRRTWATFMKRQSRLSPVGRSTSVCSHSRMRGSVFRCASTLTESRAPAPSAWFLVQSPAGVSLRRCRSSSSGGDRASPYRWRRPVPSPRG